MEKKPITPEGLKRLQDEWQTLYKVERPRLLEEIAYAAAQGDRSENAEYIYGKKKLREIDRRLRDLDRKMAGVRVVAAAPTGTAPAGEVAFGSTVRLLKSDGRMLEVQIVGTDEIDPLQGRISQDAPLGLALMGRKKGDAVEVATPRGPAAYTVVEIL